MMDDLKSKMEHQKADIDHFLKENGLLTFRSMDGYETERRDCDKPPRRRHPAPPESPDGVGQSPPPAG